MIVDWQALCEHPEVQRLVDLAIEEDVGPGDVTTRAIFAAPQPARARVLARAGTVVCGVPLARALFTRFDAAAALSDVTPEGAAVRSGDTLFVLAADVRAVLTAERTVLNFLSRLCGVSAAARAAVSALPPGAKARIYDTRKTTPGWRRLEKAAARTGGAHNHRFGLHDAVLIKDNHVAKAGGVGEAVRRVRARVGSTMMVEVEIDRLDQMEEAIAAGADVVLCDNFDD
ncbi:MAG: carboxylating nicotinate-nucleotide diphosphorylase, partial [Deltaproteobacteria bacterium]|nr:carboxylating nicotinate-nucleotide diphosphorylase [Deltaproteobacteria bacterium]